MPFSACVGRQVYGVARNHGRQCPCHTASASHPPTYAHLSPAVAMINCRHIPVHPKTTASVPFTLSCPTTSHLPSPPKFCTAHFHRRWTRGRCTTDRSGKTPGAFSSDMPGTGAVVGKVWAGCLHRRRPNCDRPKERPPCQDITASTVGSCVRAPAAAT